MSDIDVRPPRKTETNGSVEYVPVTKEDVAFVGTGPVPTKPYVDEQWYEDEKEAIFRRVWLHVGRIDEVANPGDFIVREIEAVGVSLLIVRGNDGNLRAFHNVCMHRGTELVCATEGTARSFSCPYHKWTYANTGELRGVPDNGNFFDLDKTKFPLMEVALDVCAGFVFVNLDRHPKQTLREYLGTWADSLEGLNIDVSDVFSEYVYDVDANWKVAYDNFQEIYHGRFVHPRSIGRSTMAPENPFGYPTKYTFREENLHRSKTLWNNPHFTPDGPIEALASELTRAGMAKGPVSGAKRPSTEHYYIFPNITVLSSPLYTFTQTIWPLGPARCRSVIRMYWTGADKNASTRFAREYRMAALLDIHSEDRDIIEAAQKGLSSRALDTVLFQVHEVTCRHFAAAVDRYVTDYRAEVAAKRSGEAL
ncbi:aromatic ring-hydroxylating dioxygenase subunit alpha [Amycolatopsis sp. GM8]|uniref:aromatic ring-hydroxylating oxygenase subunit alpha n=1 Tax=Amycolatopsis sp. GM8 TaxID=2896530 RepID=UPI001F1B7D4B|nr:aromatic ring-hydroxylating dioxygenase subunit alpha [Amycolatopsis sp. GM8]